MMRKEKKREQMQVEVVHITLKDFAGEHGLEMDFYLIIIFE